MAGLQIWVAMCTYNGARFLPAQLESIATQSRLPDELVVCDDRSTDETVEIIKTFARRTSLAVRLEINENNLGTTKNFEKAIGLCRGDIIELADQDDVWHPQKLARIADVFQRSDDTVAVCSDAKVIDEESRCLRERLWDSFFFNSDEQKRFANGQALNVLLKHPVVTGATMAFRQKFCGLLLPIPRNQVHDYWISLLMAACGDFQAIPETLIQYRLHAGQQIGAGPGRLALFEQTEIARRNNKRTYLSEIDGLRQICERLNVKRPHLYLEPTIKLFTEKIAHRYVRAKFPQSRLSRIPTVLREIVNGRYWRYSEGWKSVAKDLFL